MSTAERRADALEQLREHLLERHVPERRVGDALQALETLAAGRSIRSLTLGAGGAGEAEAARPARRFLLVRIRVDVHRPKLYLARGEPGRA